MLATKIYNFVKEDLKNFKGNYLEIGVFDGEGLAMLAKEYPDKNFWGIDPFIEDGNTTHITGITKGGGLLSCKMKTKHNLSGLSNVLLIESTSKDTLFKAEYLQLTETSIQYVFIDGDHSFEAATIDYRLAMKLIGDKSGAVVFDDVEECCPGVLRAAMNFQREFHDRICGHFLEGGFYIKAKQ